MARWIIKTFVCSLLLGPVFNERVNQCKADESKGLRKRLMTEAPQKWEEYRARGKRLQGSWLLKVKRNAEQERSFRVRYEAKQSTVGASYLMQLLEGNKENTGELSVVNSQYGFKLKRLEPESPWNITGMNLNLENGYKLTAIPPDCFALDMINRPFNFSMTFSIVKTLSYLIREPEFSIEKVIPVQRDGIELVRLEFKNHPHLVTGQKFKQQEIPDVWNDLSQDWVLLDPAHYWVFRDFHIVHEWQSHSKGVTEAQFEYTSEQDGFPILSKVEAHYKGVNAQGTPVDEKVTLEFDLSERGDVKESDFTLSAYGFPEPPGLQRHVPLFVWFALGGILCLGGAIVYRRWSWRRGNLAERAA